MFGGYACLVFGGYRLESPMRHAPVKMSSPKTIEDSAEDSHTDAFEATHFLLYVAVVVAVVSCLFLVRHLICTWYFPKEFRSHLSGNRDCMYAFFTGNTCTNK